MATYYVRADGTEGTWSNATGPESDAASCMSAAVLNNVNESMSAGDVFIISGLGGVYRSLMYFEGLGTSGSHVRYVGSNSPEVNGCDLMTGFALDSGSTYALTGVTTEPKQVWFDGSFGDRQTSATLTNDLDWYWAANTLYVYSSAGNPDTVYTSPGVEVCQRDYCGIIHGTGSRYVDVDGITFSKSNLYAISGWENGGYTIENCICEWAWWHGIQSHGSGAGTKADVIIQDNVCRYNGICGIQATGDCDDYIIRRNECYENCTRQDPNLTPVFESNNVWSAGIKIFGSMTESYINGFLIEQNYIHDNGFGGGGQGQAAGIWMDACLAPSSRNVIQHNFCQDNNGDAYWLEISNNCDLKYNISIDDGQATQGNVYRYGAGIAVDTRSSYDCNYNLIYGNTITGAQQGIRVFSYEQVACDISDNIFRNNIVVGSLGFALWCDWGGDNDGVWGSGNVYDSNCFGDESADFIHWDDAAGDGSGGSTYSTYDAWLTDSLQTDNNTETETGLFTDSANDDYTLTANSPGIGAGTNLGSGHDEGLLPASTWPDSVVTGDQDDY